MSSAKKGTDQPSKAYQILRMGAWFSWFLFIFTISEESYFNQPFLPNVNRNYNQKFNPKALFNCVAFCVLFALHHSIFIRDTVKKYLFDTFGLSAETQLQLYTWTSLFFLYSIPIFWMFPSNQIGGGTLWTLFDGYFLINNIALALVVRVFFIVLGDLEKYGIIQSDKIIMQGSYGIVRHPAQTCMLCLFWMTPIMTVPRFVFTIVMTMYIAIGLYFEEQDLLRKFGRDYVEYKKTVPAVLPYRLFIT